jgi:aminoglycoside phosphotransferase (APT) family kinase protein
VVKAGRTEVAGALLEDAITLTALLARRLDVSVPVVRAVAVLPRGRAVVYPRLAGSAVDFGALTPGPGLAAEIGRALAHVHNIELPVFEEAGRPTYDAETHRKRTLSELDRASASGHAPTGLLARWEQELEDVSLWRFAPTAVHGPFTGSSVLAGHDAQSPLKVRVVGLLGWEDARVADPADDFAQLLLQTTDDAVDTVLEAYVQSRIERPDGNLLARARLAAQMSHVRELDELLRTQDEQRAEDELRHLEEREAERDRQRLATTHRPTSVDPGATQPFPGPASGAATQALSDDSSSADLATQPITEDSGRESAVGAWQTPPDSRLDLESPDPRALQTPKTLAPQALQAPETLAPQALQAPEPEVPHAPADAVDDRHEGASEFVPIHVRPRHPKTGPPA